MSEVFQSVFMSVNAFVYRCKNDADYTMEHLEGAVQSVLGYSRDDVLGNAKVSYAKLMAEEDAERAMSEIDAAIAENTPWDVFYHVKHADGRLIPVRERGAAIYDNGKLCYLEGLVVCADAEKQLTDEIKHLLEATQDANHDIVALTTKITKSLRQLSMLSINARIEAARSGEVGRGFAIVASEMKLLAEQNTEWASVIRDRLDTTETAL